MNDIIRIHCVVDLRSNVENKLFLVCSSSGPFEISVLSEDDKCIESPGYSNVTQYKENILCNWMLTV